MNARQPTRSPARNGRRLQRAGSRSAAGGRWRTVSAACAALAALPAWAGDGLIAPSVETLWPHWQARITVQAATSVPLGAASLVDAANAARNRRLQGGAVLGDYVFATPSFGSFRASGGLMAGTQGGAPLLAAALGPRVELSVAGGAAPPPGAETPGTVPYLGLGFSGSAWRSSLAFSADLGVVAERPGAAGGLGRAVLGTQGTEAALRELRLSPVLQLGVRYAF